MLSYEACTTPPACPVCTPGPGYTSFPSLCLPSSSYSGVGAVLCHHWAMESPFHLCLKISVVFFLLTLFLRLWFLVCGMMNAFFFQPQGKLSSSCLSSPTSVVFFCLHVVHSITDCPKFVPVLCRCWVGEETEGSAFTLSWKDECQYM